MVNPGSAPTSDSATAAAVAGAAAAAVQRRKKKSREGTGREGRDCGNLSFLLRLPDVLAFLFAGAAVAGRSSSPSPTSAS